MNQLMPALRSRCLLDQVPHKFCAKRAQLLCNFAELLERQLERNWALQVKERRNSSRLMRSLDCYEACYLFVEVSTPEWRVLHVNDASHRQLGGCRFPIVGQCS